MAYCWEKWFNCLERIKEEFLPKGGHRNSSSDLIQIQIHIQIQIQIQTQIHTRNTKYKYKYFVHICICICNCISYHSFLLFLLPAAGAGDQIFQKIAKMLHCIKSLVLDVYNFFFAHHLVQLMVEAGRRKHITIILHITEKNDSIVWRGLRRNSSKKEVTETPPLIW